MGGKAEAPARDGHESPAAVESAESAGAVGEGLAGDVAAGTAAPAAGDPRDGRVPVRLSLFAGLCGAAGASAGWFLWIAVPQVVADPGRTLRSIVAGWVVGVAVELARWYRRLARGEGAPGPRTSLFTLAGLPLAVLVVQAGAQDAVAELADDIVVPLAVSLATFFLAGAVYGIAVLAWLPLRRDGWGSPLVVGLVAVPVIAWCVLVSGLVAGSIVGLAASLGAAWSWVVIVAVTTTGAAVLARRGWQVVPAWAACCGVVFAVVLAPFFISPDQWGNEPRSRSANLWPVIVPLSEGVLAAPDVPAAAWIRADRELAAEDALNRALAGELGCDAPGRTRPAPDGLDPVVWRAAQEQLVVRRTRMCAALAADEAPGLTRSAYVASLFALGVATAPWLERRSRPAGYRHHVLRRVDLGLLLTLTAVAAALLAVL